MNPNEENYAKNKKLIYIAIIILLGGLLVLLILAFSFFYKPPKDNNSIKNTPTPTPIDGTQPTIMPTVIVNENALLYYIAADSNNEPGQLMSFNPANQERNTVDTNTAYTKLIAFDSNNSYLAFVADDGYLSFREMSSGKITKAQTGLPGITNFWYDADDFLVTDGSSLKILRAPEFKIAENRTINYDQASDFISISPDLQWVLAKESSRLKRTFLKNIDNGKINYLELYDLDDVVSFNYLNWLAPQKLIFFNSIGLSALEPNNMIQTRLLSFNIDITTADELSPLYKGAGGINYYFSYKGRLNRYVEGKLLNTQLLDLKSYSFYDPIKTAISPNEKYAAFDRENNAAIIINLNTTRSIPLCDFYCFDPVWEN
jgi:hypothetical protein